MIPANGNGPIHILGAGSIGLLWSWYLAESGADVRLIVREVEHSQQQITLEGHGSQIVSLESPATLTTVSKLIVCTKAFDALNAINSVSDSFTKSTVLYLLQNGMGSQAQVAGSYPHLTTIAGVSTEGALKSAAFHVAHTGVGATRWGVFSNPSKNTFDPADLFRTRLNQVWENNIEPALWQKLLINACINPLTVKYDCLNGGLAKEPDAQDDIDTVIAESRDLLSKEGKLHYIENIETLVQDVILKTANNSSSMRQDVINYRPTEIDYINGYIVRAANQHKIDTPLNAELANFIRQQTS